MATQLIVNDPNNDMLVIDNAAAPTFPTLNAGAEIGYDTTAPGTQTQGLNPYGDTGTVLLDSVNDTFYADPSCATFAGNPVAMTAPTFAKVTTVLNTVAGQRLLWKNPAVWILSCLLIRHLI
jgi:hypothetical protein